MGRKNKTAGATPTPKGEPKGRRVIQEVEPVGLTYTEGAKAIAEDLQNEPPVPLEGGRPIPDGLDLDPEEVAERRRKARESGELDDAADSIEDILQGADLEGLEDLPGADDPEGEGDDSDGDEGDEPGEPEGDPLDLDELGDRAVTVKVQGEDVTVTLREALAGYQRQADYTRKTTELADQRKEASALRDSAAELAGRYQQALEFLGATFQRSLTPEQSRAVEAAYQRAQADQQAVEAHALQETLERESALMREALGWSTEEEAVEGVRSLQRAASEYGFQPHEVEGLVDHRLAVVLADAANWRELQATQGKSREIQRKTRKQSLSLKPGQPTQKGDASKRAVKARRQRLAQTGSLHDGAAAIADLLED